MDKTFCIFGDSATQAAYVKVNWVSLFRQYLEDKYKGSFINVFGLGVGGNTTSDILKRFENESIVRNPSSIIFQVGVNDSGYLKTTKNPITNEKQFETNTKKIIDIARNFWKDITFIGLAVGDDSILKPLSGDSAGRSYDRNRVERYDKILRRIAEINVCKYIQILENLAFEDFMDGIHPNEQGHIKIFEIIKEYF